ncbi:MAG: hypothetical protein BAJALOKI2v1_670008 [Promethearchaeota archaeon]|nr:MAG: hypothetical protein BAJALOKI2v1_670008 [Candidatus Lokiarchaeota archaeon]
MIKFNYLHEIYRILKEDGILLIFEHHEPIKPFKRVLFYFYLGFWENLFSHSLELQRSLFAELHSVRYKIISQKSINKFLDFFQIILAEKQKS